MKVCIQRVSRASVWVDGEKKASIGKGLLLLVGFEKGDEPSILPRAAEKIIHLRIFEDDQEKMNHSLLDVKGELLVVSQFTLAGSLAKGRRPSFDHAMPPGEAKALYEKFIQILKSYGLPVKEGIFQAMMEVELVNQGPVTFVAQF